MSDDAVKMWAEMYQLILGRKPDTGLWRTEVPSGMSFPGSWNKPLVCKTAHAFDAHISNHPNEVNSDLDWWVDFCRSKPLGGAEGLTPEVVYRGMPISAAFGAGALAYRVGHGAAETACLRNSRAHIGWLALGVAGGPGREVTDHHLDKVGQPCVLIGDGREISAMQWVAAAGPRGWVRNRKKGEPQVFLFANTVAFSATLAMAAGLPFPHSAAPLEADIFNALLRFAPGVAPFGLSAQDRDDLRSFMKDPTDPNKARKILLWVQGQGLAPSQGYTYIRYADGSVAVYMHRSYGSSTDPQMISVWYRGGKVAMASADDGLRSSSDPQIGFETPTSICCQKVAGGLILSVPKPVAAEAYRVVCEAEMARMTVPRAPEQVPVDGGTTTIVTPPARRRRRWLRWPKGS